MSCKQWVQFVRLFERDASTRKISTDLRVSYDTAYRALNAIRESLPVPPGLCSALGEGNAESTIFGLNVSEGRVNVDALPSLSLEEIVTPGQRVLKASSVFLVNGSNGWDAFAFACDPKIHEPFGFRLRREDPGRTEIATFKNYSYAWLSKRRNVSVNRFPLYLRELIFRYNGRSTDLFEQVVQHLCSFVPKHG